MLRHVNIDSLVVACFLRSLVVAYCNCRLIGFIRIWHSPPWRAHLHPMFLISFVNHCANLGWSCKCDVKMLYSCWFLFCDVDWMYPIWALFPLAQWVASFRPRLGGEPPWFYNFDFFRFLMHLYTWKSWRFHCIRGGNTIVVGLIIEPQTPSCYVVLDVSCLSLVSPSSMGGLLEA